AELHREPIRYDLACLTELVEELDPDLLFAELQREAWEAGNLSTVPFEYREALIPLAARTNIVIVPIQGAAGCEAAILQDQQVAGPRRAILRWLEGLLRWFQRRADGPRAIHSGSFGHVCHTICVLEGWTGGPAMRRAWDAANRAL